VFGQIDTNNVNNKSFSKDHWVEIMPKFTGGEQAIYKIISDSMVYPKHASLDRIGGKVITQFTIDTLGNIVDIKIVKGIRDDIDSEALRLIGLLNNWTPGTQNGKKVNVVFNLPLYFYPDDKFKKKYKKENNMNQ
jgi:protein TonB